MSVLHTVSGWMDNADWRLTVAIADHKVTVDGSGQVRVDGEMQHVIGP